MLPDICLHPAAKYQTYLKKYQFLEFLEFPENKGTIHTKRTYNTFLESWKIGTKRGLRRRKSTL